MAHLVLALTLRHPYQSIITYFMNPFSLEFYRTERNKFASIFPTLHNNFPQHSISKEYSSGKKQPKKDQQRGFRLTSTQIIRQLNTTFNKSVEEKNRIGGYKIIKEIGKGGFAQVYEVHNYQGKVFALKEYVLATSFDCYKHQEEVGEAFFERGLIRKQFRHHQGSKHLIGFVEKFRIGRKGYIVQEKSGQSLGKLLSDIQGIFVKNQRVYEVRFKDLYDSLLIGNHLAKLILQIAQAVQLLNQQGYVHCDLKSQNILIGDNLKIIDFGSTFKVDQGLPKITITPEYMPPELLLMLSNNTEDRAALKKTDVWSMGCIVLEIVTGVPLWFKYKCQVEIKGNKTIQMSLFALANREYHKIIRKHKELCQNIGRIAFVSRHFEQFRPLLKKIFVYDHQNRIDIDEVIQALEQMQ